MDKGRPPSLQMFAGMSSLHGVRRIFAAGSLSLRRAAWALLFVGSLALLALASAERVGYFLAFPRVTRVDETAAPNLTFPAVTLCNLNAFRLSKLTRNDLYHAGRLLALLGADGPRRAPLGGPESLAALRDKADFQGFKARPFDMAEFYNRTGHDLPEMLWRCAFRGVACSARNFTLPGLSLCQDQYHLTPGLTPDPPGAAESSDGVSLQQSEPKAMDAREARHCSGRRRRGRRLTFPAVSFCNLNQIRRSRLSPYDLPWVGQALLGVEPSDYPAYGQALGWPELATGRAFPGGSFNLREFVERTSHKLEDMLLACRFGNRPCGAWNFSP
ncbi:hypothetical protein E2320_022343, partial [Naja naja]